MRIIWAYGNEYLTEAAPWTHYKTDIEQAAIGTRTGLNLVALFGVVAQPIIPDAAEKILDAMNIPRENRTWDFRLPASDDPDPENFREAGLKIIDAIPHGHPISIPDVLFDKIEDDDIASWSESFGGE